MITQPGIYTDIASDVYFGDPCEQPSLTQSLVKVLIEKSPLHAWHAHPRLNPDYRHDDDTKFDIGNIAHAMLIGRGKNIAVLEGFDDWRTNAAKEARARAAGEGKIAVLGKQAARASKMVDAARQELERRGLSHLFRDGDGEVVLTWREDKIYLRQMVDWLTPDLCGFADYKTTGESAAPHRVARKMVADGWPIQAAMAERGLDTLNPESSGRRHYFFLVQEDTKPYAATVVEIGEGALTMGRKQLQFGVNLWRECMQSGRWPGYPDEIVRPDYPTYAETEWLGREIEAEDRRATRPINVLDAG